MLVILPRRVSGTMDCIRVWVLTMKVDWDIPNTISIAMDRANQWDWARTRTDIEPKTRHMSPRLPLLMTNPRDAMATVAVMPPTP